MIEEAGEVHEKFSAGWVLRLCRIVHTGRLLCLTAAMQAALKNEKSACALSVNGGFCQKI